MKILIHVPSTHWHCIPTVRKEVTKRDKALGIFEICWLFVSVAFVTNELYRATMEKSE